LNEHNDALIAERFNAGVCSSESLSSRSDERGQQTKVSIRALENSGGYGYGKIIEFSRRNRHGPITVKIRALSRTAEGLCLAPPGKSAEDRILSSSQLYCRVTVVTTYTYEYLKYCRDDELICVGSKEWEMDEVRKGIEANKQRMSTSVKNQSSGELEVGQEEVENDACAMTQDY